MDFPPHYNVKEKEVLQTSEKYFVSNLPLIYAVMKYKDQMIAGMMENLMNHPENLTPNWLLTIKVIKF